MTKLASFDWDEGNLAKCRKHGVSVEEIEQIFLDEDITILPDPEHSHAEERFKAIGCTVAGRWIFLAFTLRFREQDTLVRPVSARYMHGREVAHYEKENPGSSD